MSYDDATRYRDKTKRLAPCSLEQIWGARAACRRWIGANEDGDPGAVEQLYDMLDLRLSSPVPWAAEQEAS